MADKKWIRIIYGDKPRQMVKELLEVIKPEEEIDKNAHVGIKPNLVVAKPSCSGATTSPEIVEGLIEYLKSKGYNKIVIMEGSWVGDRTSEAFKVCDMRNCQKNMMFPLLIFKEINIRLMI